jgi:LysR family glycine cleavage system transcriptional activator
MQEALGAVCSSAVSSPSAGSDGQMANMQSAGGKSLAVHGHQCVTNAGGEAPTLYLAGRSATLRRMQFRDLPPLNFLPAFEAAGRLGSVKAAAAQLHLTPSAISQQLKQIEDALGTALFERHGRAIKLTLDGASYLREVQEALSELARASQRLRSRSGARVLRLTTSDFIAYEFLLPRLASFRTHFPGLELSLEATTRTVDFAHSDVHAAIRIGDGPWPGLHAHVLGEAWVTPVCSPALATQIRTLEQLRDQTLIEVRGLSRRGWSPFLKKEAKLVPGQLLSFEGYLETMRAAEQGLGVAFGVFPMTTEWVTSGRLAVPLPVRVPLTAKICFVHRQTDAKDTLYRRLAEWLSAEYATLPALPAGRVLPKRRGSTSRRGRRQP